MIAVDIRFEGCRGGFRRILLQRREGRLGLAGTRLEEGIKGVLQLGREPGRELLEEALMRLRTSGPNEAFQCRRPGEHHLPRAELGLRVVIQVLGWQAVLCTEREPLCQALPRGRIERLDL